MDQGPGRGAGPGPEHGSQGLAFIKKIDLSKYYGYTPADAGEDIKNTSYYIINEDDKIEVIYNRKVI